MSFPKYPAYEDSGVEWLGELPSQWQTMPLRAALRLRRDIVGSDSNNTKLLSLTLQGVIERDLDNPVGKMPASFDGYQHVDSGELVFCLFDMDETPRTVGVAEQAGMITSAYTVMQPQNEVWARYLYYFFLHVDDQKRLRPFYRGLRKTIRPREFLNIRVPHPTSKEARNIGQFLDSEIPRIDALIAEQQRLIELLKEKRQAVISQAVTKGLDPSVPMKDSGVAWLGNIPEHWIVRPLKYCFDLLDSRRIPLKAEDRGSRQGVYPYYGASGIIDYIDDYIFSEDLVLVSEDGANLLLRSTPIAFVARGQYWVNNHAHIMRPLDGLVEYWAEVIDQLDVSLSVTGAAQPKLTAEALGSLVVALPPDPAERKRIQQYIAAFDTGSESLISEAQAAVGLLKERRSALISAAVTGKIDVRNWQPPATNSASESAGELVHG